MYNVLLVDDEPTIREGLRTLIPWAELGFEVIDTAANGLEALQKYKQKEPDLLIADIRMPGMTGLELVKAIREQDSEIRVLILSGYADFEYAKQAIYLRIDGYLLKPVDEEELTENLTQLRGEMDQNLKYRTPNHLESGMEKAVQSLLADREQVTEASSHWDHTQWDAYEVILVKPLTRAEVVSAQPALIKHKLETMFDERDRGIVFSMEPYIGILLKGGLGDDRHSRDIYNDIKLACEGLVSDFSVVSGGEVRAWFDIPDSYQLALERMKSRFFHEVGRIVNQDRGKPEQLQVVNKLEIDTRLSTAMETFYLALEIGNREAALQVIHTTAEQLKEAGYGEEELKSRFVHLFSDVLDKLSHSRSEIQSTEFRTGLMELYKEYRYVDLLDRLSVIAESMAQSLESVGTDIQVKRMTDLINRNYRENLKLEKLAELFNYNSAYLGKLFKQVTGEHFNTYLDKVRIEKAKLLLEQGYKVYQVAEKVGYANVDYFHTKFRKYVGCSPTSYKKM